MKLTLPKVKFNPRLEPKKEKEKITINETKKEKTPVNYRTIVKDNEAEIERLKAQRFVTFLMVVLEHRYLAFFAIFRRANYYLFCRVDSYL